jgi:putative peptide zinc metalloprotease protein
VPHPTRTAPSTKEGKAVRSISPHPRLEADVELIGELPETGFTSQQWLARRGVRFIQITELLFRVLEGIDGDRSVEEIAEAVTSSTDYEIVPEQVAYLIAEKLIPAGLIVDPTADADHGSKATSQASARSPLAVGMPRKVIGPDVIEPVARTLSVLYVPPVIVGILALAAVAHVWLYFERGVTNSIIATLFTPGMLLSVLGALIVASVFHELGHAAALTYGGGRVRGMGVGFYFMYPAFYTDVTDSYRLGRWARVRTDLGGFYFYLIVALVGITLHAVTGEPWLVTLVLLINVDILRQLLPFVRFDGYWAFADLAGIPDPFSQIGPFARSLSARIGSGTKLPPLKRWVKVVYLTWLAATLPVLGVLLWLMVTRLPDLLIVVVGSMLSQLAVIPSVWRAGDFLGMVFLALQLLVLALEIVGISYLLISIGRSLFRVARAQPTTARRTVAGLVFALFVGLCGYGWIPQLPVARGDEPAGVERFEVNGRSHVTGHISYPQSPPVGGDHAPTVQNCGFYASPVDNENTVHSLEHGAVWITYSPRLPNDQIEALRRLAKADYLLVSPYPDQPAPIVASAWGRQLRLNVVEDARLDQFIDAFRLGQQAPESGGPCTGGRSQPN